MTWIFLIAIIVLFVGMSIFSNSKRKKQMAQDQERKDKLCVGTKIITIGGVKGEVVSVDNKDSSFMLKSGESVIKFDKRAIYEMILPEEAKQLEKQ